MTFWYFSETRQVSNVYYSTMELVCDWEDGKSCNPRECFIGSSWREVTVVKNDWLLSWPWVVMVPMKTKWNLVAKALLEFPRFVAGFRKKRQPKGVLVRLRHVKSAKRLDEVQAKKSPKRFKEAEQSWLCNGSSKKGKLAIAEDKWRKRSTVVSTTFVVMQISQRLVLRSYRFWHSHH